MRRILITGLLSSLALTATAATKSANDASASTAELAQARPVSTGVTNPQLLHSTRISIPSDEISDAFPHPARVVLKVKLDATGSPIDIQVVKPITQQVDARVVDAVRQFRWSPAVLDNRAIPVEMNLIVEVQR